MKRNWDRFFKAVDTFANNVGKVTPGLIKGVTLFLEGSDSVVVGGAAFDYIHGHQAADIDIMIDKKVYNELCNNSWTSEMLQYRFIHRIPESYCMAAQQRGAMSDSVQTVLQYKQNGVKIDFILLDEIKRAMSPLQAVESTFDINIKTLVLYARNGQVKHEVGKYYREGVANKVIDLVNDRNHVRSATRAVESFKKYKGDGYKISPQVADILKKEQESLLRYEHYSIQMQYNRNIKLIEGMVL